MKKRSTGAATIASLALACVFGATMLLSLATGAGVYRRVVQRVERSSTERVGLTYITAKIHGCDREGTVYAGSFGGADAVYLLEEIDGLTYETILYVCDGELKELFCEQEYEFDPSEGETIASAQALSVRALSDRLLQLSYTDENGGTETVLVYLRSGSGLRDGLDHQL